VIASRRMCCYGWLATMLAELPQFRS